MNDLQIAYSTLNDLQIAYSTLVELCGTKYVCPPLDRFRTASNGSLQARVPGENKSAKNDAAVLQIKLGNQAAYICSIHDYSNDYSNWSTSRSKRSQLQRLGTRASDTFGTKAINIGR